MSDRRDDLPSIWSLLTAALIGGVVGVLLLAALYMAFLYLVLPALG